ncbi:uncharacterized protein [Miscanthus floridulus]|uniref:uncharacterized protein isoform X3 n=1 Tax=Miscanthus floridulus TaxID=154761 RepID=UPI00345AED43
MRNSELGCGGTEQRRGVAVALSCGDAAAQGRWRGEAVTLWRGAANWAARDATGSARGPARRLMTSAHGLGSSMTWKPCQRKSRTERRKRHCIGRSKMQPTESKGQCGFT